MSAQRDIILITHQSLINYIQLKLKRGKEIPVKNRHHWIFSGAVENIPRFQNGDIAEVLSHNREFLGYAFLNNGTTILARMINFEKKDPFESIRANIRAASELRKSVFKESETNCYRLVNGEGDYLSGIVIDRYADVFVIQIVSSGFERYKKLIVEELVKSFKPKCIYEKSNSPARSKEGLKMSEGVLYGELPSELIVRENNIFFKVDIKNSQKTGLFLDQKEMRKMIGDLSFGKSVLNCFSYTGGFSLYAAKGGANTVTSIDIAKDAIETAKENFTLNKISHNNHKFLAEDAFQFLSRDSLKYDVIILDPPAFAKKREDLPNAKKGYLNINKTALAKIPSGGFLLTCSCSYHMTYDIFEEVITRAANETGRKIKILSKQILGKDHPLNLFHNEIDYLKSLLLYVE